jgi:hypothetical protein
MPSETREKKSIITKIMTSIPKTDITINARVLPRE